MEPGKSLSAEHEKDIKEAEGNKITGKRHAMRYQERYFPGEG